MRPHPRCIAATAALSVAALAAATPCHDDRLPPELCATEARSDFGMVATGSPEATAAGVRILERGGNAIDAAVAAALTLSVADSDASGIGGTTSIVLHLANGRTFAVDGTARSPMNIDIERFRRAKTSGRNFGYEFISVPTTLATLEFIRERYGTMTMAELLQPAIEVAESGYELSEIQIVWTKKYYDNIMASSLYMRALALEDGHMIGKAGDVICQPDLASALRRIAEKGTKDFYFGSIADQIEADMIVNGSFLRKSDLVMVRVREVPALHTTYRGLDVFTFPHPGGGSGVVATLNLFETFPGAFLAEDSVQRHHALIECFRIAAADAPKAAQRTHAFGPNPLSKEFARDRAAMIVPGKIIPAEVLAPPVNPECETRTDSTTQVSVADSLGNVVSLTQTLSRSFGAKVATPGLGFPYNSFLEAFNADKPECPGYLRPNTPFVSDMAPTIVLDNGTLFVALGSPGSNRIPALVAKVISNMVDRGMGVRDAVTAPRVLWGGVRYIRAFFEVVDPISNDDVEYFDQLGFEDMTVLHYPPPGDSTLATFGGVNAVAFDRRTGEFTGVGDPRRQGVAMGPRVVPIDD